MHFAYERPNRPRETALNPLKYNLNGREIFHASLGPLFADSADAICHPKGPRDREALPGSCMQSSPVYLSE